jgi:hypothetical protein
MFDRRKLTKALGPLNFRPVSPLQYELVDEEPVVRKYLSFRLLGVYRWELEGKVGLAHDEADEFARKCLHDFGGSWWQWALSNKRAHPFVAQCYMGRLAGWPSQGLSIKELSSDESAARVQQDVQSFVLPFLSRINSPRALLDILLRDEDPMPWLEWGPLHRLGQVVFLAHLEGLPTSTYSPIFKAQHKIIASQLRSVDPDWYLEKLAEQAALAANPAIERDARKSGARPSSRR